MERSQRSNIWRDEQQPCAPLEVNMWTKMSDDTIAISNVALQQYWPDMKVNVAWDACLYATISKGNSTEDNPAQLTSSRKGHGLRQWRPYFFQVKEWIHADRRLHQNIEQDIQLKNQLWQIQGIHTTQRKNGRLFWHKTERLHTATDEIVWLH